MSVALLTAGGGQGAVIRPAKHREGTGVRARQCQEDAALLGIKSPHLDKQGRRPSPRAQQTCTLDGRFHTTLQGSGKRVERHTDDAFLWKFLTPINIGPSAATEAPFHWKPE